MNTRLNSTSGPEILTQEYDLGRERSEETQFYIIQSEVVTHASDGQPKRTDNYRLQLKVEPGNRAAGEADVHTCVKFTVQMKDDAEVSIPSLAGWSYEFSMQMFNDQGLDAQGLMWGIPHDKFEGLEDSSGGKVSIEAQYQVYSAFTYFHSWCNGVAQNDAQGLRKLGDRNITDYSGVESPINLGAMFAEGSIFKHGVSTVEFKGLSVVDGVTCALVSFGERDSGYFMLMKPMPVMTIKTNGGTRYGGDLAIDLSSLWVKKATVTVTDITKTTMYGLPVDVSVIVTTVTIESVSKDKFDVA